MSQAPSIVAALIDRFEQNRDSYKNQSYNETQVRREFLDPLFEALGWDVANKQGHAEAYKDVIHEDAVKIGGNTKAPDYCFRIGGARKFFLEAKKPAVNVKDEIPPAYQLRRYAWSAKLPLSILTDFEEFAVYDCRTRPNPSDKPSTGRILYLTYRDYLARWEEIASIFTKEAVLKGSFDRYAVTDRKRGTATVDAEFLKEIETWREALAKNLALRNPALTVHELNFSVQRTIDRLIFLRIAEDRGIEPYAQLQGLLSGQNIYSRLRHLYEQADDRYNSGLFHFQSEKGRAEAPDELTPGLKIDDKALKDIIGRLYYPNSPYEFSVFPTEILGQVYEQFLGKVIRLTSGHQAKVEEKPEVKKAGGVYYTPAYIVDYIVKQTVGALCDGKTPKQISKLRILDPACGSGSFLIGAYRYLLNYHRDWYVKDGPEKHRKALFQTAGGEWRLTTQEKKRILLNNIYGVDIDSQAVEVTKLSLLLKVLEGESEETLKRQLSFVHERALPDLGQNIKCGNSLIGPDYFVSQVMSDDEEIRRVNPFDWKAEFPEIIKAAGFDAVIGNPPYLFITEVEEAHRNYFSKVYQACEYRFDVYGLFSELAVRRLLRDQGLLSFIIPHTLLSNDSFEKLRGILLRETGLEQVMDIGPGIFSGARNETMIFIARKSSHLQPGNKCRVIVTSVGQFPLPSSDFEIEQAEWEVNPRMAWQVKVTPKQGGVAKKMEQAQMRLGGLCTINQGLRTGDNVRYLSAKRESGKWKPAAGGKDVARYAPIYQGLYVYYDPAVLDAPRKKEIFESPEKLVVQEIRNITLPRRIIATYDAAQTYCLQSTNVINLKRPGKPTLTLKFLLAVLNSDIVNFYFRQRFSGNNHIASNQLAQIPIPIPNASVCRQLDGLVESMLDLHKRLSAAKTSADKDRLQRQIAATDQEIDRLVYDLYDLTEEEVQIVEAASVASSTKVKENDGHESEIESADRSGRSRGASATVAQPAQYPVEGSGGAPESPAGAGKPVYGVREPAGQYGSSQDPDAISKSQSELGSTREFETAEGRLSYSELSERLAAPLVAIYDEILQAKPDQIVIDSEWLCVRHKRLAGHLFPDWAGRFRDVNVQVGAHIPPPYYEVPIHMRQFCDDLAERLRHDPGVSVRSAADFLAWADWRSQWIHPFKDFNGRIGRVLLAALLYKIALPHVETAPTDPDARREYLEALQAADEGSFGSLTEMWTCRITKAL